MSSAETPLEADGALELSLKLAFSQRRLEESEGLALRLRETLAELADAREALAARCATLKQVQEALLADKLTAERRVAQLEAAREAVAARGRFAMAASGGHTPWAMYGQIEEQEVPWGKTEIFQTDERIAPPGSPERNLTNLIAALSIGAIAFGTTMTPSPKSSSSSSFTILPSSSSCWSATAVLLRACSRSAS